MRTHELPPRLLRFKFRIAVACLLVRPTGWRVAATSCQLERISGLSCCPDCVAVKAVNVPIANRFDIIAVIFAVSGSYEGSEVGKSGNSGTDSSPGCQLDFIAMFWSAFADMISGSLEQADACLNRRAFFCRHRRAGNMAQRIQSREM